MGHRMALPGLGTLHGVGTQNMNVIHKCTIDNMGNNITTDNHNAERPIENATFTCQASGTGR